MPAKKEKEDKSIEELFKDLEAVLHSLENPETGLEESFKIYESGMGLIKNLGLKIDTVEKQLSILENKNVKGG